jgi:hypothetical protein
MLMKTILTSVSLMLVFTAFSGNLYSQDDGTIPTKGQNTGTTDKTYDESGFDSNGFDMNGYDKDGYNKSGINKDGYDRNGTYRHEKTVDEKASDGSTGTTGNSGTEEPSVKSQPPPSRVDEK